MICTACFFAQTENMILDLIWKKTSFFEGAIMEEKYLSITGETPSSVSRKTPRN